MPLFYNGAELSVEPFTLPLLGEDARIAPANITYFTGFHASGADFDPEWAETVREADVVFHEERWWPPEAKIVLEAIAAGIPGSIRRYGIGDSSSYGYRRLSSVFGTGIRQDFWDASADQAEAYNLPAKLNAYHRKHVHAEALLANGNLDEALLAMQSAKKVLATHDAIRDSVGVSKIMQTVNESDKPEPNVVVFSGGAHLYQAAMLAHRMPRASGRNGVFVRSLVDDPSIALRDYDNYLRKTPNLQDTLFGWLLSLRVERLERTGSASPDQSRASLYNKLNSEIKLLSAEEASAQLLALGVSR